MNNSILLLCWSCCIACMPRARPWLVTRWKRDWQGQNGTHGAPSLFPECHLQSNILSFVTYCGKVKIFCVHLQCRTCPQEPQLLIRGLAHINAKNIWFSGTNSSSPECPLGSSENIILR